MPAALLRQCSHPGGCPELVESGRCPAHSRQADRARAVKGAPKENWRWGSWRWRKFSERFRHQYPFCGMRPPEAPATADSQCQRKGVVTPAKDVDHIIQVTGLDDPLCFAASNLQALCKACHSGKTLRERRAS